MWNRRMYLELLRGNRIWLGHRVSLVEYRNRGWLGAWNSDNWSIQLDPPGCLWWRYWIREERKRRLWSKPLKSISLGNISHKRITRCD